MATDRLLASLHDPIRLAEDAIALDLLSGGRIEMTLGIGYRPHEYEMFGIEKSKRVPILEEARLMLNDMQRRLAAEFFGTFWLVFGVCGSALLSAGFPGAGYGFIALAVGLRLVGLRGGGRRPGVRTRLRRSSTTV